MEKKTAEDFVFGKVIGDGSFSSVYLAKDVNSSKEYAIKVCSKKTIIQEKKTAYVNREKSALLLLNSPYIISLACTFQDRTNLYFVLTYAAKGELLKYINQTGSLNEQCAKFYSAELLLAIEEMHRKNIIHRDLKPENLLLSHDMHLMIADFGSSKILSDDYDYDSTQNEIERIRAEASNDSDSDAPIERPRPTRKASFVGTAQYVSPEILKGFADHPSTDLWAFGCIIYQCLSGSTPFQGATDYLIFQKITNLEYGFSDRFNSNAQDLISKLLRFNPKDRLGSDDTKENRYLSIKNHPFFDGIDWTNLNNQTPPDMNLPQSFIEEHLRENEFNFSEDFEPGLGERQLRRILQQEFEMAENEDDRIDSESSITLERLLEDQRTNNEWSIFVHDNELIIKYGFINKRKKGLFTRRRMLLLTTTPRLIYIDPTSKIKKGEIPFDATLTCEPKNFQLFNLHTPNRIYYLEDSQGEALSWCEAIEKAKQKYIKMS